MLGSRSSSWLITIDGWHPTRLNRLLGCHWAAAARRKKSDRLTIGLYAKQLGVPAATCKRRVSLEITFAPRQRAGDPDAYWKSTLDGLVKCGLLKNDSHVWCELGKVEFKRGLAPETIIRLEDLPKERA